MLQLRAPLQALMRLGDKENNLHELGSPGFDHDLRMAMDIFNMARQMGNKPNYNITWQSPI